jgi:hypothetical protein
MPSEQKWYNLTGRVVGLKTDRQIRERHQKYNIPGPERNSSGPAQQELNDLKDQLRSQQQFEQWKRQAELPLPGIDPVNNPFR